MIDALMFVFFSVAALAAVALMAAFIGMIVEICKEINENVKR